MNKLIGWVLALAMTAPAMVSGLTYETTNMNMNGRTQTVYTVDADLESGRIVLEQALSQDLIYGIETTSSMAARHQADVAVNGMFYDSLGRPAGIMVFNGRAISTYDIGTPSVMVGFGGQAAIGKMTVSSEVRLGSEKVVLAGVNKAVYSGQAVLFTQDYGKTTRVRRNSINYCVKDGRVDKVVRTDSPVVLAGYDYVVTTVGIAAYDVGPGDVGEWSTGYKGAPFEVEEAFQTGGWLVKDGEIAVRSAESYIGATNALAPRTLVGVRKDGHLLFVVVDGRQPGISEGMTGLESARLMLEKGCVDAAFLDGGASSTLAIAGQVANVPSGSEERGVAHSILLTRIK